MALVCCLLRASGSAFDDGRTVYRGLGVAERYAHGDATSDELDAAREAAWDATAWEAADAAACDAAQAARAAARDAQTAKFLEIVK